VSSPLLVVVRHGRTEWNAAGRFQGRADPPLDEVGRRQAEDCGKDLASRFDQAGLPSPVIVSSDLRRAADTAAAVAGAFAVPFRTDEGLREVDVGAWEGLTRAQVRARFPDQYRLWSAGTDVRRGGGETLAEGGRRVADRIEAWWEPAGGAPLVVVGHGMATRSALAELRVRARVGFPGDPPHLANGAWLALVPPGGGAPPIS
jgi:probable phosphoglycerate mutase